MDIRSYLAPLDAAQRANVAAAAGTTVAYLTQLAGGHRKASHKLARRLQEATGGAVTVHDLRPDIFGPAPTEAA